MKLYRWREVPASCPLSSRFYLTCAFSIISILTCCLACSEPTKACFTYSPTDCTTSTEIVFNAACSEQTSFYRWTFGDGSSDTTTTELTISHKYLVAGTYTVTLNALRKDYAGFVGKGKPTESQTITIQ